MTHRSTSDILIAALLVFAALGGTWLITPTNHPDPTTVNYAAAWLQVIGGTAIAFWLWRRNRCQDRTSGGQTVGPTCPVRHCG